MHACVYYVFSCRVRVMLASVIFSLTWNCRSLTFMLSVMSSVVGSKIKTLAWELIQCSQ